MMSVPISIALVGVVVAAILGFVGGWIVASGNREEAATAEPKIEPEIPSPVNLGATGDPLADAWERLPKPRVVLHFRMDGRETWRRTRGQAALDRFRDEVAALVSEVLPAESAIDVRGEEILAVAPGNATLGGAVADALRAHEFRHSTGDVALVSAATGVAEEGDDSLQVQLERAFAAVSEAGRRRNGGLAIWSADGVRHLRPVDAPT